VTEVPGLAIMGDVAHRCVARSHITHPMRAATVLAAPGRLIAGPATPP
jgi:hypothetical protein